MADKTMSLADAIGRIADGECVLDPTIVGRLVKRLHVRQLVAKIPRTRRWRVTDAGRHLLSLAVRLYRQSWPELAAA